VSAAALRAPAPWHRAARAEIVSSLSLRFAVTGLAVLALLVLSPAGREVGGAFVLLMFFFPLVHGQGGRGPLDEALPVGTVAHDLTRVACGTAMALVFLCVALAVHLGLFLTEYGQPYIVTYVAPAYVPMVIANGLAAYLAGWTLMLRARRPGRVLLGAFLLALFAMGLIGVEGSMTTFRTQILPDGTYRMSYETSMRPRGSLLRLGVAVAAVWLVAWTGRHGRMFRLPGFRGTDRGAGERKAAVLAPLPRGPRKPASTVRVALRQMRVLAPRMVWPLLVTGIVAGNVATESARGALAVGDFNLLALVAFLWPVLVWMDERNGHPWDQAHPAGTLARRLLHALAGLLWLELCTALLIAGHVAGAARGGTVWLDAWVLPGVPLAAAAAYCLGTAVSMLPRHPLAWGIAAYIVGQAVYTVLALRSAEGAPGTLSPVGVLSPLTSDPSSWSTPLALVWLPLLALLAAAAIHLRIRWDQGGASHPPVPVPA
jgi:hypothetical protein